MAASPVYISKLQSTQGHKKEYLFVNNVRFISMAAVVAMHCSETALRLTGANPSSLIVMVQPFKFGTIGFFLISGFLMGKGLTQRNPLEYLARRVHTVLLPWLLWFSFYCSLRFVHDLSLAILHSNSALNLLLSILGLIRAGIFDSIYWFVPNLMFSLCFLLLCRRFLDDLRLGAILLGVSLIYGINVHAQWVPVSSHSEALFGFVFYLWLGIWAARNARVIDRISQTRTWFILGFVVLSGLAALQESSIMIAAGATDALDTLRISNQLFSVAAVVAIVKMRGAISPRFLNVRNCTFGIYLIHPIALSATWRFAKWILPGAFDVNVANPALVSVCLACALFVAVYGAALGLATFIVSRPQVSWIVGNFAKNSNPSAAPARDLCTN